jgi:hypothetical protein
MKITYIISLFSLIVSVLEIGKSRVLAQSMRTQFDNESYSFYLQIQGIDQETSTPNFSMSQKKESYLVSLEPMANVTNVSELRDVQQTDWAYEALNSLVERYGCIFGYPNAIFRGNRTLSRYEFAAGLNACMNVIERLLQENAAVLGEDIDKLQRLAREFKQELTSFETRINNLENRTAFLEDHQFSTTTKLTGSTVFALADVYGGDGGKNQTVLQERVNLNLATSLTGKDLLLTSLWAGSLSATDIGFNLAGTESGGILVPSSEGTLSSQFVGNTDSSVNLIFLSYRFPVGDDLEFRISSGLDVYQGFVPTLNPYLDDGDLGRGAVSTFGQRNPIYATGGGTGLSINYQITKNLLLSGGYLASGLDAGDPSQSNGLFNGGYGALGQLTWQLKDEFSVAAVVTNTYSPPGTFGPSYNGVNIMGTAVSNTLAGQIRTGTNQLFQQQPVSTNTYAAQFSWQPSSHFALSGWLATGYPRLIGRGDGEVLTYALNFAFPDLGKEGNLLGFVVGAEPYLTSFSGGNPQPFEVDIPLHIEAFYRYQLNDNISITSGLIWLAAPNQDNSNADDAIATIRTTFQF